MAEESTNQGAPRGDADTQAAAARQLLAGRLHGVVSTIAADLDGHPFGSVTPYCLDQAGVPHFLLSHLAQHTKNLDRDPRVSLTVLGEIEGDVQQASRLTGVGEIRPAEDAVGERYFRYFPQSRMYFEQLNFHFYRMEPKRWHFNSGFATARWFGNDRLIRANPLGDDEVGAVNHMNQDHRDALRVYLSSVGVDSNEVAELRLCGADGEGMDIDTGKGIVRVPYDRTVDSVGELRKVLVEMARA